MSSTRESLHGLWSSRWVFILAAAGSAVGLGNIWRFPYLTGENGGGAFVLVYLGFVLLIGIPIMIAETIIGRRGRRSPVNAILLIAEEESLSRHWSALGLMGIIAGFLTLSFYSVVAGWSLAYVYFVLTSSFATANSLSSEAIFTNLISSPVQLLFWHTLFIGSVIWIVSKGVSLGLERAVKILMPLLFVMLVLMMIYSLLVGDALSATKYLFATDFSSLTSDVILLAVGQAFFSLSLGMGALMIYGSYLPHDASIPRTCLIVGCVDTLVALLAGFLIFPIVFAYGLEAGQGPGLVFVTLTVAFADMPFGQVFGFTFFLLLTVAAWTSAISLLEPVVAWSVESKGWSRNSSSWLAGCLIWLIGIFCLLSFNELKDFTPGGRNIFDWSEYISANVLLPLGGFLVAVFVGWRVSRMTIASEFGANSAKLFNSWLFLLKYCAPIAVTIVFLNSSGLDLLFR